MDDEDENSLLVGSIGTTALLLVVGLLSWPRIIEGTRWWLETNERRVHVDAIGRSIIVFVGQGKARLFACTSSSKSKRAGNREF